MNIQTIIFILVLVGLFFLLFFINKKIKKVRMPNVYLVTGGVKTGKSFISVSLAVKTFKKEIRHYYISLPIIWLYNSLISPLLHSKKKYLEKPMLYSNMSLRNIKFNPLTIDVIMRKVRIPYRSVVLIDEASLTADSMMYQSPTFNQALCSFVKLFGHETCGGTLIANSQNLGDLHYAFKRSVGSYLWIISKKKYPFVTSFQVREMIYSGDTSSGIENNVNLESEEDTKPYLVLNKYYKYYDCYCYSIITDDLPVYVNYDVKVLKKGDSLKTDKVVSLFDLYQEMILKDKINLSNAKKGKLKNEESSQIN